MKSAGRSNHLVRTCGMLLLALGALCLSGQGESPSTIPASQPAATAKATASQIQGNIKTKDTLTRIVAVDRQWADVLKTSKSDCRDDFVYEAQFDPQTGAFLIPKLLPGRTYDLIVWTKNAAVETTRWEGVSMDYHREITPDKPATAEDRQWIEDWVAKIPEFYDKCRVLSIAADHKHATVLVELIRTRDFYADKGGEVIYRTELWYFENLFGGWAKDKNTEKVMARWRSKGDALPKNWQFVPQIGGIEIDPSSGEAHLDFTLPEKPDPKRGLAGSVPK